MSKLAHYSAESGRVLGLYSSAVHGTIPTPAIEISEGDWLALVEDASVYRIDAATRKLVRVGPPIDVLAQRRLAALAVARDQSLSAGAAVVMPGGIADRVQIRDMDEPRLAALLSRAMTTTGDLAFRGASNQVHSLAPAEMIAVVTEALGVREALLTRFWAARDAVEAARAANDPAAIEAVTWA